MLLPLSFPNLVLACFAPAMTTPTALNLMRLLPGWNSGSPPHHHRHDPVRWPLRQLHPARFHRLFASAPWSLDQVGLTLFMLMLGFLPEGAAIFLGAETPWPESAASRSLG